MDAVVRAKGLKKYYDGSVALDGLDLQIKEGTVLGLLGPNGAGKTTVVRILTTLLRADSGSATVAGFDISSEADKVRERIGVTGQFAAVDERLTARENLELIGRFNHMDRAAYSERASYLLERMDLMDASDRLVKGYSGGMKRRVDIAMSLVASPRVLFLDEPTTGLDPRSRLDIWALMAELKESGVTILLTTQYLDEADFLSDSIIVIDRGRTIAEGTAAELKETVGGARALITLRSTTRLAGAIASVVAALGPLAKPGAEPVFDGDSISLPIHATTRSPELVRALDAASVDFTNLTVALPTLDDVFMTLTGHESRS